jgi:PTS system arbutin/cellobiose/salicin-specific IIC component
MASPGLFTSVQFFDPQNPMSIVWVFGVMIMAIVMSFIVTLLLGFEDIPVETPNDKKESVEQKVTQPQHVNV